MVGQNEYAHDLEEWLIGDLIMEPWQFDVARHLVSPGDFSHVPLRLCYEAMLRLADRNETPLAIAPTTVVFEIVRNSGRNLDPEAAAGMLPELDHIPPLIPERLQWCCGEVHRLAEQRRYITGQGNRPKTAAQSTRRHEYHGLPL